MRFVFNLLKLCEPNRNLKRTVSTVCAFVVLPLLLMVAASSSADAQAWSEAKDLNVVGDTKSAKIVGDPHNGFHVVYSEGGVKYRRFKDGVLSPPKNIHSANFTANPQIAVTGTGDVHIVWENWIDGPDVGWAASFNNGETFTPMQIRSNMGAVKFPLVAPIGPPDSSKVVMSFWNASNKQLYYDIYDGANYEGVKSLGSQGDNEYCVTGMTQSLQDGTVYRSYGRNVNGTISYCYRRFNGTSWDSEVVVASIGFFAWPDIAVNSVGQVMTIWDRDSTVWHRLFTPGQGWHSPGPVHLVDGHYARVRAVPGTADFYTTFAPRSQDRINGRRFSGGAWMPVERINHTQTLDFTPDTALGVGRDGTLYAGWEYWKAGGPRWHFAFKPGPGLETGIVTGVVRSQYGFPITGVTVGSGPFATLTGLGGVYTLNLPGGLRDVAANKEHYTGQTVTGINVIVGQSVTQDFLITAHPPANVQNFNAVPSSGIVRLQWQNSTSPNFYRTMIRFSTVGYPASLQEGSFLTWRQNSPGSTDSFNHSNLIDGVTYYYAAFAFDADNHSSGPTHVSATPAKWSIGAVKNLPNGNVVDLQGKVVTFLSVSDQAVYISEPNRSAGIRVSASPGSLAIGDRVNVSGVMNTRILSNVGSERQITSAVVTKVSSGNPLEPLSMKTESVGGAAIPPFINGVIDADGNLGTGLNNMGLLVRITGRVTAKVTSFLYIDDGMGIKETAGRTGVMVRCPNTSIPAQVGDIVSVTGVVEGSVPSGWDANRRLIRLRDFNDLVNHSN